MPLHNLIVKHITEAHKTAINDHFEGIELILKNYVVNLSPEERQEFGSIDEQNKLFANKVMDFYVSEPDKSSPQVDWTEYMGDYNDRVNCEAWMHRCNSLAEMLKNTKILHDYDNYHNALVDYKYTQYMDDTDTPGYKVKREELAQFFKNSGSGGTAAGGGTPPAA